MSRGIEWFRSTSAREREKKAKEYQKRMFPFGEPQKEWEMELLHKIVSGRWNDQDLIYQLLCVKECLWEDEEYQESELELWRKSPLTGRLSKLEQEKIVALARLEQECESLEEMKSSKCAATLCERH